MLDVTLRAQVGDYSRRVVADRNQPARFQEINHMRKKLYASLPLNVAVQSIAKGIAEFVRM